MMGLLFVGNYDTLSMVLPVTVGGVALCTGGSFFVPCFCGKGGCPVVTYGDMFTYTLVIIGIISLVIQIMNTKKK